jgi:predicted RND superfamily exporter protein
MKQAARFVVFHPWVIIGATFLITVCFAAALISKGISFNGSPETLARNDETLKFFNEVRKTFGDDRVIIVALTTDDVFDREFLARLYKLTRELSAIRGVDEAQSLTNIKTLRETDGTISVEKLIPSRLFGSGATSNELAGLRNSITKDPLYVRHFVSTDGRSASVNVFLKSMDEASIRATAEEVESVAKRDAQPDEVLLAGVPIIEARGVRNMIHDFGFLSPIAGLLCFVVFMFAFRSVWGALLPMVTLVIGLTWTIGLMSLVGRPITVTTLSMPTVLMAVGGSYIFHVMNQHRISMSSQSLSSDQSRQAWLEGFNFICPAVTVSAFTTMAGFGALASSSVSTVRDMGIFNATGVFAMLVLSIGLVPATLSLLKPTAIARQEAKEDYAVWLNKFLKQATAAVLFRRKTVIAGSLLIAAAIGFGSVWLKVNTDYLKLFPRNSETVRAADLLHQRLAGAATVQLVLTTQPGTVLHQSFLEVASKLEQFALSQEGVDAAISIADIARQFKTVMSREETSKISDLDYERYLAEDESIFKLINRDQSRATIILRTNLYGSSQLRNLVDRINEFSSRNLPPGISVRATGSAVVLNDASDAVAASQVSSLFIALVGIYLMMAVLFRSARTGLLALIPNLLPILAFFGLLGWTGTTLDITTSLIASAVLGLAVDNAVHMIRRYRQASGERASDSAEDQGWAMWFTMLRTGKPMVLANLMLIAAFLIFVLSSFAPVRVGGILWALTIFACLIADLVFLPALMRTRVFAKSALGRTG